MLFWALFYIYLWRGECGITLVGLLLTGNEFLMDEKDRMPHFPL